MLSYIKLVLKDRLYLPDEYNDKSLVLLGNFLIDDCGCSRVDRWIDWLKNPQYEDTESNFTFIEKEGDNIVMGCQFTEDPYGWIFESTIDDLVYILQEWQKLCFAKKREIIITRENGKFRAEGRD